MGKCSSVPRLPRLAKFLIPGVDKPIERACESARYPPCALASLSSTGSSYDNQRIHSRRGCRCRRVYDFSACHGAGGGGHARSAAGARRDLLHRPLSITARAPASRQSEPLKSRRSSLGPDLSISNMVASWTSWAKSGSKSIKCSREGLRGAWSCDVSSRPCRRR